MPAGLRLAIGLLTVVPVGGVRLDRRTAGTAMLIAPGVGALLGLVTASVAAAGVHSGLPDVLAGALAVGALALLTRGLHLDGLADTADGLGSGRPAEGALEVMRRSDIGPFGVVTLVLVLLAQAAAIGDLAARSGGAVAVVAAVAAGRVALGPACRRGVPAARPAGLGATVAGTVPDGVAVLSATGWSVLLGTAVVLAGAPPAAAAGVPLGLLAGWLLLRRCVRRLGGVTGDVLGACVETAQTAALVALVAARATGMP